MGELDEVLVATMEEEEEKGSRDQIWERFALTTRQASIFLPIYTLFFCRARPPPPPPPPSEWGKMRWREKKKEDRGGGGKGGESCLDGCPEEAPGYGQL